MFLPALGSVAWCWTSKLWLSSEDRISPDWFPWWPCIGGTVPRRGKSEGDGERKCQISTNMTSPLCHHVYTPQDILVSWGRNGIFADSLRKVQSNHTGLQNGPSDTTHVVLPHVECRLACVIKKTVRRMELWLCRLGHKWHCGFHLLLRVAWSGCQDTEQAPGEDYMERSQDLLPLSSTNMSVLWVVISLADPFVFR